MICLIELLGGLNEMAQIEYILKTCGELAHDACYFYKVHFHIEAIIM